LVVFGILIVLKAQSAQVDPETTFRELMILFAQFLLLSGIIGILGSLYQGGRRDDWSWLMSQGLLDILLSALVLLIPAISGGATPIVIGIWCLFIIVFQLKRIISNWSEMNQKWVPLTLLAISIVLTLLFISRSINEAPSFVGMVMGATMIGLGLAYFALGRMVRNKSVHEVRSMRKDINQNLQGISSKKEAGDN
jgi:uncharacterized membrane protein HdeD (DUF308 family)